MHGSRVVRDTHLAYRFLGLGRKRSTLLYVGLQCVNTVVLIIHTLITKLSLVIHPTSNRPLSSIGRPLEFTTVIPLRICGALQAPRRGRQLGRARVLVVNNKTVSRTLRARVGSLPKTICSACNVARALSRVTLHHLGKATTSRHCCPFSSMGLSLSPRGALIVSTPLIYSKMLRAGSVTQVCPSGNFVVLKHGSGIVGDNKVGVRTRRMRGLLHPFVSMPFIVASIPSRQLKRTIALLVRKQTSARRVRGELRAVLAPCCHPGCVLAASYVPRAKGKGIGHTRYSSLTEGGLIAFLPSCPRWLTRSLCSSCL